jgi:hypothetical protein
MFEFKESATQKKTPTWKRCKCCLNVQGISKKLCSKCDNDKFWIIPLQTKRDVK